MPAGALQPDLVWMGGKGSPAWGGGVGPLVPCPRRGPASALPHSGNGEREAEQCSGSFERTGAPGWGYWRDDVRLGWGPERPLEGGGSLTDVLWEGDAMSGAQEEGATPGRGGAEHQARALSASGPKAQRLRQVGGLRLEKSTGTGQT